MVGHRGRGVGPWSFGPRAIYLNHFMLMGSLKVMCLCTLLGILILQVFLVDFKQQVFGEVGFKL